MKALVIQTALKQTAKAQSCLTPLLSTPTLSQGKVLSSGLLGIFQALTAHVHTHVYIYACTKYKWAQPGCSVG